VQITVAVQFGNRTAVEQLMVPGESRQDWRNAINSLAARIELSTFGPAGPVEAMAAEDKPLGAPSG
jgi:hypothetical protein